MKKSQVNLLIALVLVATIAGTGFYFLNKSKDSNKETEQTQDTNSRSSVKKLLAEQKNVQCDLTYQEGAGKIYIADKKIYGDFTSTVDGESYQGYMIQDGDYSYVWSAKSSQGVKIKADEENTTSADEQGAIDNEEEGDVSCSNWSVDNSKFTPPSNVTFTDLTSALENSTGGETICNSVPDAAAKQACLDALN